MGQIILQTATETTSDSQIDALLGMVKKAPDIISAFSQLGPWGAVAGVGIAALFVVAIWLLYRAIKSRENEKAMNQSTGQAETDQNALKPENKKIEDEAQDALDSLNRPR
jgi:membrane protein implicated in regulation of membrane protease activity